MKYPEIQVSLNMAVTKDKMSDNILRELGVQYWGRKLLNFR